MRAKTTILIFIISFLLISSFWKISAAASPETESGMFFEVGEDRLIMHFKDVPLGDILDKMKGEYFSDISGLEHRRNERITLNVTGKTVEDILKQFLKYLDEDNYAFEFLDEDITMVSVFPRANIEPVPARQPVPGNDNQGQSVGAARVVSIIEGSQAETVGLAEGDIIIEYDGIKIDSSMSLIREVKKKSDTDQVKMVVMREGTMLPFILKGGVIGVRISTSKIPEELEIQR